MTATTSKRKKYVREMKPTWWKKLDFYKLYIAREATAIPTLWFCLVLLYGVISLDSFGNFISFLKNPIVIILNIITLGAMLLNTVTYYVMTPKVLNIIVKNERINPNIITMALWAVTAFISLVILVFMYV
ncbi:fumarate reductase subunit FrdC [Pasteurella multocida]|uniref:fumarate reductase subunit FrdC n=1 Tax=Pasteurella multocida TaxID=747 RepID=UPI000E010337|nr:fumarate reductase subunit FrdC [Pasteurella multocida]MCL7787023.1 fumarate reductase subunit FrdC [Pasteurella multocida]MCL7794865.1 fumarate reductase subunit FrdC [Pasteurella multocida]URI01708.1 fumarate reductase subunit FrdC [Pasteurella multocida]SUB45302.1 fumarate reductase subunit C [Pasteurella multocida subsp. septica]HDR1061421.1 fumarate reductase subunit FrdC [Pasteurella multocida]